MSRILNEKIIYDLKKVLSRYTKTIRSNREDMGSQDSNIKRDMTTNYPQKDRIGQWATGDNHCPNMHRGIDHLRNPSLYKGMSFTLEERQALGIHGLLPPRIKNMEEQLYFCKISVDRFNDDLNKYCYLMGLLERNERLFFRLLSENVEMMMPLIYTPTVAEACVKYGLIYRRPRGLFISIHDKGHIYDIMRNWPENDVRAICVTDGERILGLGDLGANGMGIPVGKLCLYTGLAGIKPHYLLPIMLDVGTNNQTLLDDPTYIGIKHRRIRGREYDEFLQEFMDSVVKRFGQNTLVQFEDFGNANAFELLFRYRTHYCVFNDDIQGTAAVTLGGILASLRITKTRLSDEKLLFFGAGEASLGIAALCVMAMKKEGKTEEEARKNISMVDTKGLIIKNRAEGGIAGQKVLYAHPHPPMKNLLEIVTDLKPSILIGAAASPNAFTPEILQEMAKNNARPIIFALSNPTSKAECTAEAAYTNTDGKCIFASGSPFDPVTYNGKTFNPGQGNNAYIFPGVALAITTVGIRKIGDDLFLRAAEALSTIIEDAEIENGQLYPSLKKIQECSIHIATKVAEYAYMKGTATVLPEPENKEAYIRAQLYDIHYKPSLPVIYSYPTVY